MKEIILIKNGELALKGLNRGNFEDIMSKFLKDSEERMQDVKKHQEFKGKNSKKGF